MQLDLLLLTAVGVAFVHTLLGPDHYVPFIAMARAGAWSLSKTIWITVWCGIGHVLGSLVLGMLGVLLGWSLGAISAIESVRGSMAGWLLIGFGLAYTVWGLRRAARNRPHTHLHAHADGRIHAHPHTHDGDHTHVHATPFAPDDARPANMTPWVLFVVFVFGPCEALIPLLIVPAARHDWLGLTLLTCVFGTVTIATMLAVVVAGTMGAERLATQKLERYSHALAGLALLACGVGIQLGL